MDNQAVLRQLASALARAKGNKTLAKRYLLESAVTDPALLLALAQPFLDSIAGYALDLYTRRHPDAPAQVAAAAPPPESLQPPAQVSEKQKAAMHLLAASYKKKADKD